MKKIILLLALIVVVTGCTIEKLDDSSIDNVVSTVLSKNVSLSNTYLKGYKYYLPRGMSLLEKKEYNSVIKSGKYRFYLYVDVVSYYNKTGLEFKESDGFYSKSLSYNDKNGYLEITELNDKYFIEMMYNYSKIEAYVKKEDLITSIVRSGQILSSIKYNDSVINTLIGENKLDYKETLCDIFTSKRTEGNFLDFEQDYGIYKEEEKDEVLNSDN